MLRAETVTLPGKGKVLSLDQNVCIWEPKTKFKDTQPRHKPAKVSLQTLTIHTLKNTHTHTHTNMHTQTHTTHAHIGTLKSRRRLLCLRHPQSNFHTHTCARAHTYIHTHTQLANLLSLPLQRMETHLCAKNTRLHTHIPTQRHTQMQASPSLSQTHGDKHTCTNTHTHTIC